MSQRPLLPLPLPRRAARHGVRAPEPQPGGGAAGAPRRAPCREAGCRAPLYRGARRLRRPGPRGRHRGRDLPPARADCGAAGQHLAPAPSARDCADLIQYVARLGTPCASRAAAWAQRATHTRAGAAHASQRGGARPGGVAGLLRRAHPNCRGALRSPVQAPPALPPRRAAARSCGAATTSRATPRTRSPTCTSRARRRRLSRRPPTLRLAPWPPGCPSSSAWWSAPSRRVPGCSRAPRWRGPHARAARAAADLDAG